MPERQTNPDKHGRWRVRDKTNRRSGAWSSRFYDPETMLLVPNANASDGYGAALPPKRFVELPEPPAPAGDENENEGASNDDD